MACNTNVHSFGVKMLTRATPYATTEVFRIWFIILAQRGLGNKYINDNWICTKMVPREQLSGGM